MQRDLVYLIDIQEALGRMGRFVHGLTRDDFLASELVRSAVIREVIVVGEAANQIDKAFQEAHPEIPWKRMIALRHFYVHGYRKLNLQEIWRIASRVRVQFEEAIGPLIPPEPEDESE
jgi:uncharacterized protein with HEPN domain